MKKSSVLHRNDECVVNFDNVLGHFRGDISNENIKCLCQIELDQLKTHLKKIPIKELNKLTIEDICRNAFKDKGTCDDYRLSCVIACVLPLSYAFFERPFSTLKIIKTQLQPTMGDIWLDNLLCLFMENYLLKMMLTVTNKWKK